MPLWGESSFDQWIPVTLHQNGAKLRWCDETKYFKSIKTQKVQCSLVKMHSIFPKYSQQTPHSLLVRPRYWMSSVISKHDWCFTLTIAPLYEIPCNTYMCCNEQLLYEITWQQYQLSEYLIVFGCIILVCLVHIMLFLHCFHISFWK